MKRLIALLMALGCLVGHAEPYAYRLSAEVQTAGPQSLEPITWMQGSTPLIQVDPLSRGRPIASDPETTVRMIIGHSPTSTYYAAQTNAVAGATNLTYYLIQWPTIGTNSVDTNGVTQAWWYTVYFERYGHMYWNGSGELFVEPTTSTATNGLVWQEFTSGSIGWASIIGEPSANTALVAYINGALTEGTNYAKLNGTNTFTAPNRFETDLHLAIDADILKTNLNHGLVIGSGSASGGILIGSGSAGGEGTAVGVESHADSCGVAVGDHANGSYDGAAIGRTSKASGWGAALGAYANAESTNTGQNIDIGNAALGAMSSCQTGVNRTALGPRMTNEVDNSTAFRGDLYGDGMSEFFYRTTKGVGVWAKYADRFVGVTGVQNVAGSKTFRDSLLVSEIYSPSSGSAGSNLFIHGADSQGGGGSLTLRGGVGNSGSGASMYLRQSSDNAPIYIDDENSNHIAVIVSNKMTFLSQLVVSNKSTFGLLCHADGADSVVSGGYSNTSPSSADYVAMGGGANNTGEGTVSTISGGLNNRTEGSYSSIGGGQNNSAVGAYSSVAGGSDNTASGFGSFIAGGQNNFAALHSFASGYKAKATNAGAFVWGDSVSADKGSVGDNTFNIWASGGTYFMDSYTNIIVRIHPSYGLRVGAASFEVGPNGDVVATNVSLQFGSSSNNVVSAELFKDGTNELDVSEGTWNGAPLGSSGGTGDFSSVIFSGGTTSQYLSGDGSIQSWPSGSAYDHSHATNAFAPAYYAGTNLIIDRSMGPRIKFTATNNSQIGFTADWGTNFEGGVILTLDAGSYTLVWTPLVSLTATNFVTTNGTTRIIFDKGDSATNWNGYQLSP